MILSGSAITEQIQNRDIVIYPFNAEQLNPNSYNYRIGNIVKYFDENADAFREAEIPKFGFLLKPKRLYLANTFETIGSEKFVTSLIGRSSVGRLGLFVQISADLANLGKAHQWTLELTCVQSVIIYPLMIIGQVSFWAPVGKIQLYAGKYHEYNAPQENLYAEAQ